MRVEEQFSNVGRIPELLEHASKTGTGGGRPDFIITNKDSNLVILIECKTNNIQHDQASAEVKHYMKYLHGHYDLIGLATSGATEEQFKVSTILWRKQEDNCSDTEVTTIRPWNEYNNMIEESEKTTKELEVTIQAISEEFNSILTKMQISLSHKMLLMNVLLLALNDKQLMSGYNNLQSGTVLDSLLQADKRVLQIKSIPSDKIQNIIGNLEVLKTYPSFEKEISITPKDKKAEIIINPIIYLLGVLDKSKIVKVIDKHNIDVMSRLYNNFIRYSSGDTKLGFVTTPSHICQLFTDIADLTTDTRVLDLCCGTGSFLVSAMTDEVSKANGDLSKISQIKANNFYGVDNSGERYTYACINMILRGDGQSNLIYGDCFELKYTLKEKKCKVGFINPPYRDKKNKSSIYELEFVKLLLDSLVEGGTGIVIIPTSCGSTGDKINDQLKKDILEKHSLVATMIMPINLFQPVASAGTMIMVFKAHIPHNPNKKTWLADWSDDGFILLKSKRYDPTNSWPDILNEWVTEYFNQDEKYQHSLKQSLTADDEWDIRAYREVDYTSVTQADFQKAIQQYVGFIIADTDLS